MSINSFVKNFLGPKTKRKIVTFSVDDYGVQRTSSLEAREAMESEGLNMKSNRFDYLDSLETREDLTALWETLNSVKDSNGNPAIITAFACPANIDCAYMLENPDADYKYIKLPDLYKKREYGDVMELWAQGIESNVVSVQYHGREHANIKTIKSLLKQGKPDVLIALKNDSWSGITSRVYPNISYVAAVQFDSIDELPEISRILSEGVDLFKEVWGFSPSHFTAPGNRENSFVHKALAEKGIGYIDTNLMFKEHQGNGKYKRVIHLPFSKNDLGQTFIIRNAVFEPMLKAPLGNWEDTVMKSISDAFKFGKPANISTHRVNFSGNIDPNNRDKHLSQLKKILKRIINTWPDIVFMSTEEMAKTIQCN